MSVEARSENWKGAPRHRWTLAHPMDIHCLAFHFFVTAAYGLAFWLWHYPALVGIHDIWSRLAFVAACAIMLGWISGIDVGINFHNHAHKPIFRHPLLNRWCGRLWTFTGGWPSYFWYHAHVVVHHANLLKPRDWTVAKRRPDGTEENMYRYMFMHWPWRYAYHLWKDFRAAPQRRQRIFIKEFAIFLALWSIPFWIDPVMAICLWVLPHWIANVWSMGPGMFVQHDGCVEVTDEHPLNHSNDHIGRFFNMTTFNIGYHIEHHDYPHVHWSQLPALHERLQEDLQRHGSTVSELGYHRAARRVYDRDAIALVKAAWRWPAGAVRNRRPERRTTLGKKLPDESRETTSESLD